MRIKKITLYLKECYGCDRENKFRPLQRFIVDKKLPLDSLDIRRTILNPTWKKEAEALGLGLPCLVIEYDNGKNRAVNYEKWVKNRITSVIDKVLNDEEGMETKEDAHEASPITDHTRGTTALEF